MENQTEEDPISSHAARTRRSHEFHPFIFALFFWQLCATVFYIYVTGWYIFLGFIFRKSCRGICGGLLVLIIFLLGNICVLFSIIAEMIYCANEVLSVDAYLYIEVFKSIYVTATYIWVATLYMIEWWPHRREFNVWWNLIWPAVVIPGSFVASLTFATVEKRKPQRESRGEERQLLGEGE